MWNVLYDRLKHDSRAFTVDLLLVDDPVWMADMGVKQINSSAICVDRDGRETWINLSRIVMLRVNNLD